MVVAVGGIVGSLSRWVISLGFNEKGFPWATLFVNYLGSVILMALLLYVKHHKSPKWWWRPALGAGFCGGFTTYSAFALKVDQYISHHNFASAMEYSIASIFGTYILIFATNEFYKVRILK